MKKLYSAPKSEQVQLDSLMVTFNDFAVGSPVTDVETE